jgi:ABC-2 type transport system permease protein
VKYIARLYLAELGRRFALLRRYALGTVADIATFYLVFMGIFIGIRSVVGQVQPEELSQIATAQVVGFLAFYFASMVLSFVNSHLREEVEQGTLEQVFVSSRWFVLVLFARLEATFTVDLIRFVPLYLLLSVSTGVYIRLTAPMILAFLLLLLGVYGLALFLGGMTMLFKRTGQLPFLFQVLFLGFSFSSLSQLPEGVERFVSLLPFARGVTLLKEMAVHGSDVTILSSTSFFQLLANAAAYMVGGLGFFIWTEKVSKQKGLLGRY